MKKKKEITGTIEEIKGLERVVENAVTCIEKDTQQPIIPSEERSPVSTKTYSLAPGKQIRFHYDERNNKASMKVAIWLFEIMVEIIPELPEFVQKLNQDIEELQGSLSDKKTAYR